MNSVSLGWQARLVVGRLGWQAGSSAGRAALSCGKSGTVTHGSESPVRPTQKVSASRCPEAAAVQPGGTHRRQGRHQYTHDRQRCGVHKAGGDRCKPDHQPATRQRRLVDSMTRAILQRALHSFGFRRISCLHRQCRRRALRAGAVQRPVAAMHERSQNAKGMAVSAAALARGLPVRPALRALLGLRLIRP
jgi:hypothetical protein